METGTGGRHEHREETLLEGRGSAQEISKFEEILLFGRRLLLLLLLLCSLGCVEGEEVRLLRGWFLALKLDVGHSLQRVDWLFWRRIFFLGNA